MLMTETDIRCVSLFFIFHTHRSVDSFLATRVCVCMCVCFVGKKQGTGAAVDGCGDSLPIYRIECSELNLYVWEKTAPANFLAHEKSHFIEGVGHKFGFIAEAPVTQIGHKGEM